MGILPVVQEKKWRPRKLRSITMDPYAWKAISRFLIPREKHLAWLDGPPSGSAVAGTPQTSRSAMARIRPADSPIPLPPGRSEEHTSELQSPMYLVCRLLLEKKKTA